MPFSLFTEMSGVPTRGPDTEPTESMHPADLLLAMEMHRGKPMLVHGSEAVDYGDAADTIYRMAKALARLGLGQGAGVAGLTVNTPSMMFAHLAAQLIGCYYVGIPQHVAVAEQARMLADAAVSALVFDPSLSGRQAAALTGRQVVKAMLSLGPGRTGMDLCELAAAEPGAAMSPAGAASDVAELVFTGGSTGGQPKSAAYTFGQVTALTRYWAEAEAQGEADAVGYAQGGTRLLRFVPFITAPGLSVIPTLLHGGTIFLQEGFDAGSVLAAIERERITTVVMAPSYLYQLLDHPQLAATDTTSLQRLIYHGAPISPTRLADALRAFGPVLMQSYGQTESRMITVLSPEEHSRTRTDLLRSAGRPRCTVAVEVRDTAGRVLPPGETGEVYVRSPYMMAGYWKQPDLTARTLVAGWLRTGDLAYRDEDGYLFLVDRLRDIVIVDSWNCHTLEIEQVLTSHPGVKQAAVVGLADQRTGEAVHAAAVLTPDATVSANELRAMVRAELGQRHEPKTVTFLTEIPLTPLGKPDKNAIRSMLMSSARKFAQNGHS